MRAAQLELPTTRELIIDQFAGGGGASLGIEWAAGRPVDIAINHDPEAIAVHAANHPQTHHLAEDIWSVDLKALCHGRPVGLAWYSPDCRHFSKAKGGKPVSKKIRGLAWKVVKDARTVRPRVWVCENVEEFQENGPLVFARNPDGSYQFDRQGNPKMLPCPERKGQAFQRWVSELRRLGYRVEWRELRACDYGAPTSRTRLFVIGRCDGAPIVWPSPTHGDPTSADVKSGRLLPWRTAAECIDWSIPCPSIFLSREEAKLIGARRPLAPATQERLAKGLRRYVLDTREPYIVPGALTNPANRAALVAAWMAQHNTGMVGHSMSEPMSTIVGTGSTQALVAAYLSNYYSSNKTGGRGDLRQPLLTITAQGQHAGLVAAFLQKYYGDGGQDQSVGVPLHTVPTRDRFGLVTVQIGTDSWIVNDIGTRMLTPRELYRGQGFPDSYIIDVEVDGKPLSKSAQTRMCGNSVPPYMSMALVRANYGLSPKRMAA